MSEWTVDRWIIVLAAGEAEHWENGVFSSRVWEGKGILRHPSKVIYPRYPISSLRGNY